MNDLSPMENQQLKPVRKPNPHDAELLLLPSLLPGHRLVVNHLQRVFSYVIGVLMCVCVCVCVSVSVCVCASCFLKFTTAVFGNLWNKTLQILKYSKLFHVPNCFAQDSPILENVLTGCPSTKNAVFQTNHLSGIRCSSNRGYLPRANQGE